MQVALSSTQIVKLADTYRSKPALVYSELSAGLEKFGQMVVAKMKREAFGGDGLHVRTGALRRGFFAKVQRNGSVLSATVYNDTPYARIQEQGGLVYPKKGKYLAIPLDAAKTAAGVSRFPGGPRTVPDLKLIPRAGKNSLLVRVIGKGRAARMIPYFVLVPSVRVPARLGFRERFARMVTGQGSPLQKELQIAVRRVLSAQR